MIETNSLRFNNFGKWYKSFTKVVGAQSKSNVIEETSQNKNKKEKKNDKKKQQKQKEL